MRSLAVLLLALSSAQSIAAADTWSGVERIVAVGDVHGDYDQFVRILEQTELIDSETNWIGGRTHLVQTGDVPDRGPDSRKVFDLLMKLEKQARKAKGYVHALVGNHEAMNVYGDLRYVHPGEFEAFKKREASDDAEHPAGWVEHRKALGPTGRYGRWIGKHNVVIKINRTLFLHGGIGPRYAQATIRELNQQAREELADLGLTPGGMLIDNEGPLWYRGLAQNDEATETAHLEALLALHGVDRIVIGHTTTDGGIVSRFGGRVVQIDVGMSEAYGGHLGVLILEGDEAFAIEEGVRRKLP